uniref:Uncharacterized protein n=1 Tax=Pararge aegeria TaxID=116150 RepID=S4NK78_9NEOP
MTSCSQSFNIYCNRATNFPFYCRPVGRHAEVLYLVHVTAGSATGNIRRHCVRLKSLSKINATNYYSLVAVSCR